ncbi:MAG: aldehyde dehydrogenase [Deltaproteobacteria bacterium]|nr:aldehyde dehydrogenase [Candidatus Zymogenaceae bacterium]
MKTYKMYIDGTWADAADGKTATVINPATEDVIAEVAVGSGTDVQKAVSAAHGSFEKGEWRYKEPAERSRIMLDVLKKFREKGQEIVPIEVANSGATVKQCSSFVSSAQNRFEWFAKAGNRIFEEAMPLFRFPAAAFPYIRREPIGVCAQIVPWNAPLVGGVGAIAAPLAAGNSIVVKPATLTPLSILEFMKIIDESEIPKGVVNVVVGPGNTAGEALVAHPLVDKVSFTGSTESGRRVCALAANGIKKATMELGGKSANIFLDDVDVDLAVDSAIFACFYHSGQICYSGTRALVHASIYDSFVEKLVAKVNRIKVGDPTDFATDMGCLISDGQRKSVQEYVAIGKDEGARLACGGGRPKDLTKGFFFEPTVFVDVDNSMRIAQEEIFGPVLCVIKYEDDQQAVEIANNSEYGLLGAIWSANVDRAIGIGEKLRVGNVWINSFHLQSLDLPYGGVKLSGIGRERGLSGFLNEYTEIKSIQIDLGHTREQRFWYSLVVPS